MAKRQSSEDIYDRVQEILRDPIRGFWVRWTAATAAGSVFLILVDGIVLKLMSWPVDLLIAGTASYLFLAKRADGPPEPKRAKAAAKTKRPAKSAMKKKATRKQAKPKEKAAPKRDKKKTMVKAKAAPKPTAKPKRKAPVQRKKAMVKKKAANPTRRFPR